MSDPSAQIDQALRAAIADHQAGRLDQARTVYERILRDHPDHARTLHLLGVLEMTVGRTESAAELISRAIRLHPGAAEFHNNLGDALIALGRLDEAVAEFERAVTISPGYFKAYNNLGLARMKQGRFSDAIDAVQKAISIRPDYARAHSNLGTLFTQSGRQEEAAKSYLRALEIDPAYSTCHSSLLMALNYIEQNPIALFTAHREWGRRHADPITAKSKPLEVDRKEDRPLRIGYVSGDFAEHAVAMFFLPALKHRDRERFHITCYSNLARGDAVSEYIQASCDQWRNITNISDDEAAAIVRADMIDILIDLSGHSAKNRLLIFARRPAPIQATWLGYPNTTGMNAIDYRIADAQADPVGQTESLHTEKLVRLRSNWCYTAPRSGPGVSPCPVAGGAGVTFASFNNLAKVTPEMIAVWADILRSVSGSRMMIKCNASGDAEVRRRLLVQFASHGIDRNRITLLAREPDSTRHLELYGQADVVLDTYPYHGTTMTCEALWMGVPVVTLAGTAHVSRVGVSLLNSVGLTELIAKTPQEYVSIARELAGDIPRLIALRQQIRPRMLASPLLDEESFARDLELAYRWMWSDDL